MSTVLVVDDETGMREMLRFALERAGHRVILTAGAPAALKVLAAEAIDVLVSDLYMPDMDGTELIEAVRRDHPRLAIVLMTGSDYFGPPDLVKRMEGRAVILLKPFQLSELHKAVERAMAEAGKAAGPEQGGPQGGARGMQNT